MRQCYAWSLPYGVSFQEKADLEEGKVVSDGLKARLESMARDLQVYGSLLAAQRNDDLAGQEPGFLAHYRS
jgi:FMN reductase